MALVIAPAFVTRWARRAALIGLLAGLGLSTVRSSPLDDPTARPSSSRLADVKSVRERLGLAPAYDNVSGIESIKVAVLDFGFEGVGLGKGYLPEGAEIVENYDAEFIRRNPDLGDPEFRKGFEPGNRHGREMAQIIWGVTGSRPRGPKFFLLNANGPTMLRRAVRYAIEKQVDIILFSGAFEGGGAGDGKGPVDRIVDEAAVRGILWVNAAGNYGGRVYNGPVRVLSDGYLKLRNVPDIAALRFRNRADENTLTITLTWNDYKNDEDAGTNKDLDLFVEDWTGKQIGSSEKRQVTADKTAGPDESKNPRERVVLTDLPANPHVPTDPDICYRIRVRSRTGAYNSGDKIRILLTATRDTYVPPGGLGPEDAVTFVDASNEGEIYPPGDHPGVLTVGEAGPSSSVGPTLDGRIKPDVVVEDSRAYFTDGQVTYGSSNAAAYLAGVAVVMKAVEPGLYPHHVLKLARECAPLKEDPNAPKTNARPTNPPRPVLRAWKTPTRAKLSEIVRGR